MPKITLTRLTGFDRNKKTVVEKEIVTLGTDPGADVRFDPTWDKTVTPQHLTLEFRGGAWWAKDASKDGTFSAGRKIGTEKLIPGTVVELGRGGPKVQIDFEAAAAPAAPTPSRTTLAQPVAAVTQTTAVYVESTPVAPPPQPRRGLPAWVWAVVGIILLAGAFAAWKYTSGTPEKALAYVAKEKSDAVGLVVIVHPRIGGGAPTPMATAWAVAPRVYATNSHVSKPVLEVLQNGGSAYIVVNRMPDKKLKITRAIVHPRYGKPELNFEGKPHAVPAYDVGLLYVDQDAPDHFRVAKRGELEKLDSGYRIGFLGFPMEGMAGGGVEVRSPVATMQSGIITSVTDYWLSQAPFEKRWLVQHNLGATGGASGSPIFNDKGEVVAVLNAGNIIGSLSFETGQVARAPSGVMVNFAQRVDLLRDIWPEFPKD